MAFNKDLDYSKLIEAAIKSGNLNDAAEFEKKRNEKIEAGFGGGYEKTNNYQAKLSESINQNENYMKKTNGGSSGSNFSKASDSDVDYSIILKDLMSTGASKDAVKQVLDLRVQKAGSNQELNKYLTDKVYHDAMNYITKNNKPEIDTSYKDELNSLLQGLLNQKEFSYNHESDPLFKNYKNSFKRESERAIANILSDSALLTGGSPSSYAITAASQAADYYNTKLMDKIPELYNIAYSAYKNKMTDKMNILSVYDGLNQQEYKKYRDDISDMQKDRDYSYKSYRDSVSDKQADREFKYKTYKDMITSENWLKQFDYQKAQDLINNAIKERQISAQEGKLALEKWKARNN